MHPRVYRVLLATLLAASSTSPGCSKTGKESVYRPHSVPAISSMRLSATEIVPTLDTPLANSGNAVWCATFQVAWNHARDDVIGSPLRVANAQDTADRLNNSPITEPALPADCYYVAAGRMQDGILETIQRQMAERFPGITVPTFHEPRGLVTYAYLNTHASFTTPFDDTLQPVQFTDGAGATHRVNAFGLQPGTDWDLRAKQVAQVQILFSQGEKSNDGRFAAFALDLTADQVDSQVIIAVLPRAEHLLAAMDDLADRIENYPPNDYEAKLQESDILAVPNVVFHVEHEFLELQGTDKRLQNPGEFQDFFIAKAWQSISLRVDKSGATVVSESGMVVTSIPRQFVVDGPFLIVMKRRSADHPYLVAWIEDVQLLEVHPSPINAVPSPDDVGQQ